MTCYIKKLATGEVVSFPFKPSADLMQGYVFVTKKEYINQFISITNILNSCQNS